MSFTANLADESVVHTQRLPYSNKLSQVSSQVSKLQPQFNKENETADAKISRESASLQTLRTTKKIMINSNNRLTNISSKGNNSSHVYTHHNRNLSTKNNDKLIYLNFALTKAQPEICRMQFPYYMDDDLLNQIKDKDKDKDAKKNPFTKITNRVFKKAEPNSDLLLKTNKIENEQPPINQFLCYDLSRQINTGLYEVKVLADQIKRIKMQKQEQMQDSTKYKPKNKIRIVKGNKCWFKGKKNKNNSSNTDNTDKQN